MEIKCTLKNDNGTYFLDKDTSITIPESRYSLLLSNLPEKKHLTININDEYYDTINEESYSTLIDLINNIGYQKIDIIDKNKSNIFTSTFFTNTYKIKKEEFNKILDFIANNSFWKGRQFVYYDKENITHEIIDPLFIFNWIDKHFDRIEELILNINNNPNKDKTPYYEKSFKNTNKYNKKRTISYLRNNPHLFFKSGNGILSINNTHYNPQAIIQENILHNIKINEHLQILELIIKLYDFLYNIETYLRHSRYNQVREQCQNTIKDSRWFNRLYNIRNNTFLKDINIIDIKYLDRFPRSRLQYTDSNYKNFYEIYINYLTNYYNFVNEFNNRYYQHIKNIDKIYEAFCAYTLADILELQSKQKYLITGKAFKNDDIELYYQSKPSSMKGWALSDTPDVVIKHKNGKVLILDSKFKIRSKKVKGEDIQKLQAYLNNYFQNMGGILFPGDELDSIRDEISNNYIIYQIPIYPFEKEKYNIIKQKIKRLVYNCLES